MLKDKILVVDDETSIVQTLTYCLQKEGFRTVVAYDGVKGLELARREGVNLILLDWMLPEMDGLEVCRQLKRDDKTRSIPVVMLTVKSEETDKILGLEMGADDYITKPFSPRELVARVKAILRRYQAPADPEERLQLDTAVIDWGRHTVSVGSKPVELTAKEFELLKALVDAKGRVLTRPILLDRVWGYERSLEIETRTVDLHISQLRRKLGKAGRRILTIKNAGYRIALDDA